MKKMLLALVLSAAQWAGAAEPLPMTIGPYLQHPAPDAMTVCYLAQGTGMVEVLYGAGQADQTGVVRCAAIPGTPWTIWKARIGKLQPGARCTYLVRLRDGGRVTAESAGDFSTLDLKAGETRAILFNDLHNQVATLDALMKNVKPEDFSLSILLGDCWADPSPANGAEVVFRTLEGYVRLLDAAHKPMLLVRGNHETRGGFTDRLAYLFDIPGLEPAQQKDEQLWPFTFQLGPVRFVTTDTGEDDDFGTPTNSYKRPTFWQSYRQRQTPWIREVVSSEAYRAAPWHVFLSHIPLYNTSPWSSAPARKYWEALLQDAGLAAMLAGHDHQWRLLPAGQPANGATPPCPVLIGGGPSVKEATVMLLTANPQQLQVRLLDTNGRQLAELSAPRERPAGR